MSSPQSSASLENSFSHSPHLFLTVNSASAVPRGDARSGAVVGTLDFEDPLLSSLQSAGSEGMEVTGAG